MRFMHDKSHLFMEKSEETRVLEARAHFGAKQIESTHYFAKVRSVRPATGELYPVG